MSNEFYVNHLLHACEVAQDLPDKIKLDFYSYICETFTFNSNMIERYYAEQD